MLFLGWLLAAFVVVGAINVYLRFFGKGKGRPGGVLLGATPTSSGTAGETCQWLNSVLSWLFVHCDHTPDFVDAWMRGLNEQARKNSLSDYQVKFDRVQAGSLPPRITAVLTQAQSDAITICAHLETSDVTLLVSALQQLGTAVKVTNYDVHLQQLRGELKVFANYRGDQIDVQTQFNNPPELRLRVTPRNEAHVSPQQIEQAVRKAITEARSNFAIAPRGGYGPITPIPTGDNQISVGGSKPFSLRDRRLLVKVMKANSLGQRDFDVGEPYCLILLDQPQQRHTTSVVKNSSNPFWNEHYVFELDDNSRQLRFEVYDRVKAAGEDFLGRAVVNIADLRRMPSTRQIIPLTGKPHTQGTITTEFLFMEPGEVQNLQLSNLSTDVDAISPRRQVETSRRVMPGGTVVTTTTTTTEKPKDIRLNSSFQDEPQRIQKTEMNYGDYSPYSQRSPNFLAAHESASNASSQVVDAQGRHLEGPRLLVTSPYDSSPMGTTQQPQTVPHEAKRANKSPLMSLFRKTPTTTVTTTTQTPSSIVASTTGNRNSMPIESYIIQQPQQNAPLEGAYASEYSGYDQTSSLVDPREGKKSKGFASALRKRFSRGPKKPRSHSADRAGSLRQENLLKPPEQGARTTDPHGYSPQRDDLGRVDHDMRQQEGNLRKSRSHSFSNSLKRIFRKKKKHGEYPSSRESSVSRGGYSDRAYSEEPQPSPHSSAWRDQRYSDDMSRGQDSRHLLSTSVPVTAPIYDH